MGNCIHIGKSDIYGDDDVSSNDSVTPFCTCFGEHFSNYLKSQMVSLQCIQGGLHPGDLERLEYATWTTNTRV